MTPVTRCGNPPLGKSLFGVTVWAVTPGRRPGQETGLRHLTWGGPGDSVHIHQDGSVKDGQETWGPDNGTVSGRCEDGSAAQRAVDA